ncbi:hypothetical protein Golob_026021, partial [Gossypium lobatum]|nr:hypothetical protein [Gossypium lobatum]
MENVDSLRKSFKDMLIEKNTLILTLENEFELEGDLFRGMMIWVTMLWKPSGKFQVVDLDNNNYYIIKVIAVDDYN